VLATTVGMVVVAVGMLLLFRKNHWL